jgi:hypothetical protein
MMRKFDVIHNQLNAVRIQSETAKSSQIIIIIKFNPVVYLLVGLLNSSMANCKASTSKETKKYIGK